ncbi:MAG: PspC domain-containing protein [Candidatus Saccharimonas sp.]|nr:MAG: PspC domain-containing protein [Candidatus Saccharimonas sp.]
MKEVTRMHLAKTPYSVEVDAKKALEGYLAAIEKTMRAEPEVMREIETRMVELLAERGVAKDGVISLDDVNALKTQMGDPKEFSENGETRESSNETVESPSDMHRKSQKRLMRDTQQGVLGGVCSGLAAYFGIDVVLVRLIAVGLLFVSFGTAVLAYIVLWLVVPEAKTAADKLQMRGEPVTLDSLKNFSMGEITGRDIVSNGSEIARKCIGITTGVIALIMMAGFLIALVVGGWSGFSIIGLLDSFAAQPYVLGMLISLIIGGVALVLLCGLFAAMALTWRARRSVVLSMLAALIVGSLAISSTAIFGLQVSAELPRDVKRLTRVVKLDLPDMTGVKSIRMKDDAMHLSLQYKKSSEPTRAELHYMDLKGVEKPEIKFDRQGDVLYVNVSHKSNSRCVNGSAGAVFLLGSRTGMLCGGDFNWARVVFYGPVDIITGDTSQFELAE